MRDKIDRLKRKINQIICLCEERDSFINRPKKLRNTEIEEIAKYKTESRTHNRVSTGDGRNKLLQDAIKEK